MPNLKLRVAAAAIVAGAIALGSYAPAQQAPSSRFQPFTDSGPITAYRQPLSLLAKERVKVVVTMSGESVAEVRARTPGHAIDSQRHDTIPAQIDPQHAPREPAVVSRLGNVLAHYHDAMNGMKVEIDRGE